MFSLGKSVFLVDLGRGVGKDTRNVSHVTQFLFSYLMHWSQDRGYNSQGLQTWLMTKQETHCALNDYVTIPKGLIGQVVPASHLTRLGFTVNSTLLPRGKKSSLFCPGQSFLSDQEWTEGEALAGRMLQPAFWTSTAAEPNVPSKGWKRLGKHN